MTHRPGVTRTVGLLLVAAVVAAAFIWSALRPPVAYPDEARRKRHPAGFSIVVPRNWETQVQFATPAAPTSSIWMVPEKAEGRNGGFWAVKFHQQPAIEKTGKRALREGEFQGQFAWVREDTENDKLWTRNYVFQRDGAWYQVLLTRPATEAIMSDAWTAHMNTFRLESPIGDQPAAQPSTAPTQPSAVPPGGHGTAGDA